MPSPLNLSALRLAARAAQIFVRSNRLAYAEIAPDLTIIQTSSNFWELCAQTPRHRRVKISHALDEFVGAESTLLAILFGKIPEYTMEFVNRIQPNGDITYLTFRVIPLDETSPERGLLLVVEDVTALGQWIQQVANERNALRLVQVELERANAELEKLSFTDTLTGVANRRWLERELARELNRVARLGCCLTLLMIDLDDLKIINDTYGHLIGDHALRRLAALLQVNVRGMDLVARWGGDEFAILLPETGAERAQRVAERLLTAPRAIPLPSENGSRDKENDALGQLTISIGGAVAIAGTVTTPSALTQAADRALYQAKREGKNRFVIYTDIPEASTAPNV